MVVDLSWILKCEIKFDGWGLTGDKVLGKNLAGKFVIILLLLTLLGSYILLKIA